ncbi:hypothetical protein COF09_23105 [Bacillus toyonensis]|nr:hypothetical protein COF09_23105 [Bacillus toyonensis]
MFLYRGSGEEFPSRFGQRPRFVSFMASVCKPFFAVAKNKGGLGETPNKLYLRHEVASKCDACQIPCVNDKIGDSTTNLE